MLKATTNLKKTLVGGLTFVVSTGALLALVNLQN